MKKTERLYMRVDKDTKDKIEKIAKQENRSMSNWIESVVLEKLEENEMKKIQVEIAKVETKINGFNVKKGYVLFKNNDKVVGISSGWTDGNDMMYIYTLQDGEWIGNWEVYDFPVEEAIEAVQMYQKEKEMKDLETEIKNLLADGETLYESDEPIRFVDVVAGNKSSDGGEYGFYSTYYPTEVPGIYEYHTSTTCEFDACGTGYEGLVILTQGKYQYLAKEEEKILEANK